MRNQCDGCCAKKPRVRLIGGEWYATPTGNTHIMGAAFVNDDGLVTTIGYPDLMACERHLYEEAVDVGRT